MDPSSLRHRRRGVSLALAGVMMPALVGLAGLSVDTAVLATAKSQLASAADAAALGAAMQLVSNRRLNPTITDFSTEIAAARSTASAIVAAPNNAALGRAPVLLDNPSNAPTGDVVAGYMSFDASTNRYTWNAPGSYADARLLNSAQVTLARDAAHDGAIPSFFGFGPRSPRVTSTATIQTYTVKEVRSSNGGNGNLLPIVLDKTTYNAMIAGTTTDQYRFTPSAYRPPCSNGVTTGADGVPESKLYPVASGNPGNWGSIKVGVNNNSTSTLGAQIRHGITPAQMRAEFPCGGAIKLNLSDGSTSYHTFGGNPGISAGIKDDLASIIGKPVLVPIYDHSGGNGNNAWYRVIAFAGVRIVAVSFQGNPKYVIVQPAMLNDPSVVPDVSKPVAFNQGGPIRLHLSR